MRLKRWLGFRSLGSVSEPPPARTDRSFGIVLTFYQREPVYALGLALLWAYAKRELADVRVHFVPICPESSVAQIRAIVESLNPSLIAASAMSPTWRPLLPHLREIKRRLPGVPVLVGGYQAIVQPAETLAEPAVDFVCVGDGEQPMVDLIRRLRGERGSEGPIAGLWEKTSSGDVVRTPPVLVQDLTAMPFPDYSIFEREGEIRYLKPNAVEAKRLASVPIISGRGCPYRCTYCSNTTLLDLHGGKGGLLRKYNPAPLVADLTRLRDRYGVDFFQFWDEEFLYDRHGARALLELYRREVGLPFSMFVRVENMTDDLCRFSASMGCHSMWFGLESGSDTYRQRYLNRRMSNQRIVEAAETARRNGIKRMAFTMVGMPFETRQNVDETFALCREVRPELTIVSQYVPFPGTPLYALCQEHGLLLDESVDQQMWPLGKLNVKEHTGGVTQSEMHEVAQEIMEYLAQSNTFDA